MIYESGLMILKNLSVTALRKRRRKLAREVPSIEQVMRGTLSEAYKRCGRPNCHCADGPGHGPKHYLSVSQAGGWPHRDYIRNADVGRVTQCISNLHKLRDILDEICAINTELIRRHEDLG
jgi:hypothetical protein